MLGHKFNSGAVCVAIAPDEYPDGYVIMAAWRDQFVVSRMRPEDVIARSGSWSQGHYHDTLEEAVATFVDMTKIVTHQPILVKSIQRVIDVLVAGSLEVS